MWAGLNLTQEDLPVCSYWANQQLHAKASRWYPLTLVKAVAILWLFGGLRRDEIIRLRVGCIRWQQNATAKTCLLDVPVNKTGAAFTKPVDACVGEALLAWEQERPAQPTALDNKTNSFEHFLFMYRGKTLGRTYINATLIPLLCEKAGVPLHDIRGQLTSHRARATIASQLFNAKEPMSLFELQAWLGHRSIYSTQYYAKITPTKLTKAYQDAGYFERNLRTISVLIDQEAIRSGAAVNNQPWKYYDLGHGYCTYDFFDQCPHRMACAKCSFYQPKASSKAQLLEAKANLQRMQQEIPLTEPEKMAVEEGIASMNKLCEQLADIPTPAGPTPREIYVKTQPNDKSKT